MDELEEKIRSIAVISLFVLIPVGVGLMANYKNTACFISGIILFTLPLMATFGVKTFTGDGIVERLSGVFGLVFPIALSMTIVGFMAIQGALPTELSWMAMPGLIAAIVGGVGKGVLIIIVVRFL